MKIEFWSDIICPWCGLTAHRLETAIARFEHAAEVEWVHRSFQVHPGLPREGVTQKQLMAMNNINPDHADRIVGPIERLAKQEGLQPYYVIDRNLGPTDYTHEFLAYATDKGLHHRAWKQMFRAHFGDGRKFWTIDELTQFGTELGLDAAETRAILESRKYRSSVEQDQEDAQSLGARGTPFIVIDRKFVLSGANDTEALLSAMRQVWKITHPAEALVPIGAQGEVCDDNGCGLN